MPTDTAVNSISLPSCYYIHTYALLQWVTILPSLLTTTTYYMQDVVHSLFVDALARACERACVEATRKWTACLPWDNIKTFYNEP